MAAYIDEHKSRFKVGPIRRVLSESLDCGFLTPRGYRMFKTRPVSRMRARHEALARDILQIHSDFFMAVYGYRKTHAQLVAQGWDPTEVGRDQVTDIMREFGIRGVRRGRTPVATRPAKGAGGRPDLVERRFEAEAPNRLHVADITYVLMANGSFGYTAFAADVYARRIVGWACATTMNTQELPLQALEQAIVWAATHGGTDGLVHHSDHGGAQYTGTVYTSRVKEYGMPPSTGTVGDSYDNAMAESADGAYKTELVWRRKPFLDIDDPELATFRWVSWRGLEAPAPAPGPQDTAGGGNRAPSTSSGTSRPTIRAEQRSGHIRDYEAMSVSEAHVLCENKSRSDWIASGLRAKRQLHDMQKRSGRGRSSGDGHARSSSVVPSTVMRRHPIDMWWGASRGCIVVARLQRGFVESALHSKPQ